MVKTPTLIDPCPVCGQRVDDCAAVLGRDETAERDAIRAGARLAPFFPGPTALTLRPCGHSVGSATFITRPGRNGREQLREVHWPQVGRTNTPTS